MRKIQLSSIMFIVGLTGATVPGFAQTPTPVATDTPTPVPTATPTPVPAAVSFDDPSLIAGQSVTASGTAPDGPYCLSMVPQGVYSIGGSSTFISVASVGLTVIGGSFSGVTVTSSAPVGQYDLLLLLGPCGTAPIIIAGDQLDEGWGLDVAAAVAVPDVSKTGRFVVIMLIAAAGMCLLWRRAQTAPPPKAHVAPLTSYRAILQTRRRHAEPLAESAR